MAIVKLNRREVIGSGAAFTLLGAVAEIASAAPVHLRPDYSLQKSISDLKVPDEVTIIGTGRLGAWIGVFAATAGVSKLNLVDPGSIDVLDIACTPFLNRHVGHAKVYALREIIVAARPDATVSVHHLAFDASKADLLKGVVFNGASSQTVFDTLPQLTHGKGLRYAAGAYSGAQVIVTNEHQPMLKLGTPTQQPSVWVGSAALAAMLAVHSAFVSPINFAGSISQISQDKETFSRTMGTVEGPQP